MKLFVGGSLRDVPVYSDLCVKFVERLGERIVEEGHILLTGCRGSLDKAISRAAFDKIEALGLDPRKQLISYRLKHDQPVHRFGRIHVSAREDWDLAHPQLSPPEQIAECDVALFVAGGEGTFYAKNWARIADKPVLGIAQFGGSGAAIYEMEKEQFDRRYAHLVEKQDFDLLNQDTDDIDQLVNDVLYLCDRVFIPNTVFSIMSFKDEYRDLFGIYEETCELFGFNADRTDESPSSERIIPRILEGIRRSAFVIADISEPSENVFYEIGYAQGLGREVIVTAKAGTRVPFDLADTPVEFWADFRELKGRLEGRIRSATQKLGRSLD